MSSLPLRATRLSALVGDLDPIAVSAAIGIDAKALIHCLDDAPERDQEPVQVAWVVEPSRSIKDHIPSEADTTTGAPRALARIRRFRRRCFTRPR